MPCYIVYVSTGSIYANYAALTPWVLAASRCTWPRIPWCLTGSARCPACTAHSRYFPLAPCHWWAAPSRYSPLAACHWWAARSRYPPLATCHWWATPSRYSPLPACYWRVARQLTARRVAGPSQLCSPTFLHNRKGLQRFNVNKSLAGRLPVTCRASADMLTTSCKKYGRIQIYFLTYQYWTRQNLKRQFVVL